MLANKPPAAAAARPATAAGQVDSASVWAEEPEASPLHPARFAPERWLTPDGAAAAAASLPFGAGKRSCLGASLAMAEAVTVLVVAARQLVWAVPAGSERWSDFPFPVVKMDATCAKVVE